MGEEMYSNSINRHSDHLRLFQLFRAVIIIASCILFISLLFPLCSAKAANNTAFLPAIYHLLNSSNVGWKNTSLTHPIPLTYEGYDEEPLDKELRQCKVVQVEDGYWIAFTRYYYGYLFLMKINLDGRTMIPPFQLTTVTNATDGQYFYRFTLIPREDGGVQVLTTEWGGEVGTTKPDILHDYLLNRSGQILHNEAVLTQRTLHSQGFKALWATRTADGRTSFVALSDGAIWCGIYTNSSDARTWEAVPAPLNGTGVWEYFAASYDPDLDRLYLMYSDYYKTSNGTFMTRWTPDGTREVLVDYTAQIGYVNDQYSYQLLPTPEGLLVSLPRYTSTYKFLLLNSNCTVAKEVNVNGLVVDTLSVGHMVTIDDQKTVRLVFRERNTNGCKYAVFDLTGKLLIPKMDAAINDGTDTEMHPHVFVNGRRTTILYSGNKPGGYRMLICRHLGYDFTSGQPDLVVSAPHIIQSPGIASLGDEIWLLVRVFNRGEAVSSPASVTLTYNGATFSGDIGQLDPGENQEVTFSGLITPAYLSSMPTMTVNVPNGYWSGNNSISSLVRYPNSTPIYPAGAGLYTWTVENRVTSEFPPNALVSILVPNILTVDGQVRDIILLNETDDHGEISFRLPNGTYTFYLSKYGYASDNPEITVPGAASTLTLDPPGDLALTFVDAKGGALHPTPNRVKLTLEEQGGSSRFYIGRGDENGLLLNEIMPATYSYTITAFGYLPSEGSITIHGGNNSFGPVSLTPTDRGIITGHVTSGGSALGSVYVSIQGTGLETITDSSGNFSISDLPYGTYTVYFDKEHYLSKETSFTLSEATWNIGTADLPAIPAGTEGGPDLGNFTHAAWNRVDSFPGFLDAPSYKITTTYGAFNFQGSMIYSISGEAADFSSITLNISGRKWYYYSVSTEFSLLDFAFSNIGTAGEIADAAGQVAGFLVDPVGGFLDSFLLDVGVGGSGGQTIVRVDRVALYEGTSVLWDSPMLDRQEYSTDGPMEYTVSGVHTDQIQDITLKVYLKVMNENYSQGPLVYMDTFRFDWRYGGGSFNLKNIIQNPPDYHTLMP